MTCQISHVRNIYMKEERKPKMGKKEERITEQNTTSGFLLKKCNGWGGGGCMVLPVVPGYGIIAE
jgi:hypothetical protein